MVTEPAVGDAAARLSSTDGARLGNEATDVVLGASRLAGLARLDVYLYLDRLDAVVRDREFSAQALSLMAVLCARPQMWRHGYDIARETGLKSGTLYPILIRLADRGWLEASWEDEQPAGRPRRHLYRLTSEGLARGSGAVADALAPARTGRKPRRTVGRIALEEA
jgi:DNA-binding MarR family transcriptional regulator